MNTDSGEQWLVERMKYHGLDIYRDGQFASLRNRIANVLVENGFGAVLVGRAEGKPQTYADAFRRLYGVGLNDVPRATSDSNTKLSTGK